MMLKTHVLGGVAAAGAFLSFTAQGPKELVPCLLAGVCGALAPDIDHRKSYVAGSSSAARISSMAIGAVSSHRGFLHTPLMAAVFYFFLQRLISLTALPLGTVPAGFLAGYLSHLVLDAMNPAGIMWLWPLSSKRSRFGIFHAGGLGEKLIRIILICLLVWGVTPLLPRVLGAVLA